MTLLDTRVATEAVAAYRVPRSATLSRRALCTLVGFSEGLLAAAVFIAVGLAYPTLILGQSLIQFPAWLYFGYGALTGIVYGSFSAAACAKFLNGGQRLHSTVPDSFYSWTAATALILLSAFLTGVAGDLSRIATTSAYVIGIPLVLGARSLVQLVLRDRITRGELRFEKVAVLGTRSDVVNFLLNGDLWRTGHKLAGALYLEEISEKPGPERSEAVADFARAAIRQGAEYIVLVGDMTDLDGLERLIDDLRRFALNVVCAPATHNRTLKFLDVVAIGPNNSLRFLRKPMSDSAVLVKRAMDIVLASFGLLILSPLFAIVALLIIIDSDGPVIYRQERRGFNGGHFMIWKFRSMSVVESGHAMRQAVKGDARVTRIGRFIRATSIDELPQLVNVLLGQMSIVGPRPHAISHDDELSAQLAKYAHRQRIKPGITGWAQVNGFRGETTTFAQVEGRTLHDLYYIDNWSVFLDCWTIILTVLSPAARRNAH